MTFEPVFHDGASVTWRTTGPIAEDHHDSAGATVKVSDDVHVVSYLSKERGDTRTVALNLKTGEAAGFASNGKDLVLQSGSFEVLDAGI
ncbi:MAG: hypothetical protein O9327_10340 [Polaromonas sp.]|nr:hypothetical protein [Polaromonas sp.]